MATPGHMAAVVAGLHRRIELEYEEPPPLFLHLLPLSDGVVLICCLNFLVNVFVVALSSSVVPIVVMAWRISPLMQIWLSTWCIIGIMAIVACLLGVAVRKEVPMRAYYYWLVLTSFVCVFGLAHMIFSGNACSSMQLNKDHQAQRIGTSFSCGWVSAAWFFAALCVMTMTAYCAHMVYAWKEFLIHLEHSKHLMHLEAPHIAKMRGGSGGGGHGGH